MARVEITRHQTQPEMELGIIIVRPGAISFDSVLNTPLHHVPPRQKIEIQLRSCFIVEPHVKIVDHSIMDDSHVEGDQATFLPPKEQSDPIRHTLPEPDQILSVEHFEAQFRSLIDLPVQRKNLVNLLRSAPIVNLKSYWR